MTRPVSAAAGGAAAAAAASVAVIAVITGCASPTVAAQVNTIYQGTTDAAQYRSPNPHDFKSAGARPRRWDAPVTATACRTMLTFPSAPPGVFLGSDSVMQLLPWNALAIVFGDDGFASAIARAREAAKGGSLVDVRADLRTTAVLGIWRRECVEVHAAVMR